MVKNIASFILLVVICVSCGKHEYPSALVEADSLCYSNPKLALEKLAQIRKDLDTTNTADWMYFRLVKLKAQDKAYIPHSDLTNLNQMISYYEGKGDKKMLPEIITWQVRPILIYTTHHKHWIIIIRSWITLQPMIICACGELHMRKLVMSCFIKEIMLQQLTITKFLIELIL